MLYITTVSRVADMAAACVQVQKLHVDVGVQGVAVDFCNNLQVSRALKSAHLALTAAMTCQPLLPIRWVTVACLSG